ncbi:MAG: COR domain-containing protein, partial [Chloroflexota bacterium]
LQKLYLGGNIINTIPDTITQLKSLTKLDLSYNELNKLPEALSQLHNLVELDLTGNQLRYLPESITRLKNLRLLWLSGNQLIHPPQEIVWGGIDAIRNYFTEQSASQEDNLYEAKLLLVGAGRVGKTSLAKSLTIPGYQLEDEQSTEGIDVHTWIIPKDEFGDNTDIEKDFRLNIWDFGGQEIYHATHQFFLTKRSVYLLVTESRQEDRHEDFYYWFNIIRLLGDRSPILVVLNKCDQPTKELPIGEYKEVFDTIVHPYPERISCQPNFRDTIAALKSEIRRILTNKELLPHVGTPLPKIWVDIRERLAELRGQGSDYMSRDEYLDLCAEYGMNEERADFLSDFLHDLGVILHFRRDIELSDLVVLNPEWVTDGVYKVLDNETVKSQQGKFYDHDLMDIWKEDKYRERQRELLALMRNRKFDLCYDLPTGGYLAPQLLPVDKVEYSWRSTKSNLRFEYRYKFMPKGMLARFIVKSHHDIYEQTHWRYGVLLDYDDTRALVQERYFENKITIVLEGPEQKRFLDIIRHTLEEIHDDFNNLVVDEMIPCHCEECVDSDEPHFFKHESLKRCLERNRQTWPCEKSMLEVNVWSLLNDALYGSGSGWGQYSRLDSHSPAKRRKALREVLADLYTEEPGIRRMVADTELDAIKIAWGSRPVDLWHSILEEAERRGCLSELLIVVGEDYPNHQRLQEVCRLF